jgi:hypothetical protein
MTRKPFAISSLRFLNSRAGIAVGASALVIIIPVLFIIGYLIHTAVEASDAFARSEPQLARLLGVREAAGKMRGARAEAERALSAQVYPASQPADRIGTELQQRLRAAADNAGVAISGSQVIEGTEENGLEQVVVAMSFESSHTQLQELLQALALQTPLIYVDALTLLPVRSQTATGRLMVQARFCALRQAQ